MSGDSGGFNRSGDPLKNKTGDIFVQYIFGSLITFYIGIPLPLKLDTL